MLLNNKGVAMLMIGVDKESEGEQQAGEHAKQQLQLSLCACNAMFRGVFLLWSEKVFEVSFDRLFREFSRKDGEHKAKD
jgi:hypothetical protein